MARQTKRTSQPQGASPARSAEGVVPWLTVRGARHNNLRRIDAEFPLGRFTCVTGVSGSGKSSLVNDILYEALARDLNKAVRTPGAHDGIDGLEHLDKIIAIDQSPIGRTPRSNPATYIKVFDEIRALFSKLPDAKLRGYKPGRFSFNVAAGPRGGGRCEACEGNGANKVQMDFLADIWVTCPICEGRRFARETLQIQYKHASINDVLNMDVQQGLDHFDNVPRIRDMLQTLHDVGLDYVKLGQASTTLSGGEAQRIKLARELVKKATGRTLYVLDEPTTGLHFEDIRKLLLVLHGFVDAGNTVVVIEHNLDVVKTADWVIDLGPEGGEDGGTIVIAGTPEEVAADGRSHTGVALRAVLESERSAQQTAASGKPAKRAKSAAAKLASKHIDQGVVVVGAREHNLKDLTVTVPRDRMTVCTGVSGSGKTSFAIDTVFNEGYRRYVESLSSYARQFLGQMAKPRVDHVEGLSPAICIEQKAASKNPRSTVGTITEIYDYMRVLWSRVGSPYCPRCDAPIGSQAIDEIVDRIFELESGSPIILLAPVRLGDTETYGALFARLKGSGYTRVRIDGQITMTAEAGTLDRRRRHRVEVVIDRTVVRPKSRSRITESVEHALTLGDGTMVLIVEAVETVESLDHEDTNEGNATETNVAPASPPVSQADPVNESKEATSPKRRTKHKVKRTKERELMFSQRLACAVCGSGYEELTPHHFSFNSQLGWCETCEGLGMQRGAPESSIIANPSRTLFDGAIGGWRKIDARSPLGRLLEGLCERIGVEADTPLNDWTDAQKRVLMFGTTGRWLDGSSAFKGLRYQWRGFFPTIDAATRNSWSLRHRLHNVVTDIPCITCRGGRLRPESAAARLGKKTIVQVCQMPLADAAQFFTRLRLDARQRRIAGELLLEVRNRLRFLLDVGLDYLTLDRAAPTLSGGEAQRIRLASQIGSGLSGVLYVLDEPTIGLHPRDTQRLVDALKKLRNLGNTLLLVEHDRDVITNADRVLDFGPQAGSAGGELVAQGTPTELMRATRGRKNGDDRSLTREYLRGTLAVTTPANRRPVEPDGWKSVKVVDNEEQEAPVPKKKSRRPRKNKAKSNMVAARVPMIDAEPDGPVRDWMIVRGARQNNLRHVDVPIPLGRLVCVTGVSGSGKSSLVNDILWPALAARFQLSSQTVGGHDRIDGLDALDKVIMSDQSPIGVTPSSNPATYTGVFDLIRELFARLPESKVRGYNAQRFSFNRPGGRCEACEGYGQRCIEMHFMPDVWVECETCHGKRYNPETLEPKFKNRSIADVLEMRVGAALELFENVPRVRRLLQMLADVGLDYVQLGQPAPTLSGGEAQRVKLAAELGRPGSGRTLYILDEPTTGLHFDDVRKLLEVMHRLVDLGNTVVVVEHNLDVIKSADWVIELGPEAGAGGGRIVATGTPEDITHFPGSHTGVSLAPVLANSTAETRERYDPSRHAEEEMNAVRSGLGTVGRDTKMPWQVDGRRWHLEQRDDRSGKPRQWEPEALEFVVELLESIDGFEPADWSNRASVEVTAKPAPTWFMHALTGGEWLLDLYFRVPKQSFDWRKLNEQLGLKTLDERSDLRAYGNWARVDVRARRDGYDVAVVNVHDRKEIDTPAFRKFIQQAAAAYFKDIVGTEKQCERTESVTKPKKRRKKAKAG